jgi:hypothetical protein
MNEDSLRSELHTRGVLRIRYNHGMQQAAKPVLRSDLLRSLLQLLESVPVIREAMGDILQITIVLDASRVQRELRWRIAARQQETARTDLHEAMASGALVAYAPPFLAAEIQKHIPRIAREERVSIERVEQEWQLLKPLIRFYEPLPAEEPENCPDPGDVIYFHATQQLETDFVYTCDRHFSAMGARVMPAGLDRIVRDYARATTVVLTVKIGSGFALLAGGKLIYSAVALVVKSIAALPPALKALLGFAVAFALFHPGCRKWLLQHVEKALKQIQEVASSPPFSDAVEMIADSAQLSTTSTMKIREAVLPRARRSAISFALRVCTIAPRPLSADEIARRILRSGYASRSKDFAAYVCRLLREDARFVVGADGLWSLRGALPVMT